MLFSIMILLLSAFTPGTGIEDFIHMLESQDLTVEITSEENITEELKHNGAIKVSRKGQVRIFGLVFPFLPNNWIIKRDASISSTCGMFLLNKAHRYKDLKVF